MTTEKDYTVLEIYDRTTPTIYEGRLLGMLSPEEYAGIINKKELRNKLFTVETKKCSEIAKMTSVDGFRLVMVVRVKNKTVITKKVLLFTEPLSLITNVYNDKNYLTLSGKDGSYITLREKNKHDQNA